MKRKLKVLVLFDGTRPATLDQDFTEELKTKEWKTEADVMKALDALGHSAEHLAIYDDVDLLRRKLETFAPDLLFNLVEQFKNRPEFDQNIVSFFEMQGLPFTGCGSTGLTLCKHKGISKKILHYHGIHVPDFVVIPRGQRIGRLKQPRFPLVVKPVKEEASYGISQASFVQNEEQFRDRVAFIHEKYNSDAIAEQYIEGRELYVSLMGNTRLSVFPIRELVFRELPPNEPKIATYKAKWDDEYRKRRGLENRFAEDLDPSLVAGIQRQCKEIYRLLTIDGYARIDLRLTADNKMYFIEANPNPILADDEDFALSAAKAGLPYPDLIERIVRQGMAAVRD
ncbi:MAG: ATP-grasp domain-containing protein [Chthoniobacterales bacterium]|nr:ATP-grasp domain-containing protein [Chthoniobacterales bacterium]